LKIDLIEMSLVMQLFKTSTSPPLGGREKTHLVFFYREVGFGGFSFAEQTRVASGQSTAGFSSASRHHDKEDQRSVS